jgi:hypothetical protein
MIKLKLSKKKLNKLKKTKLLRKRNLRKSLRGGEIKNKGKGVPGRSSKNLHNSNPFNPIHNNSNPFNPKYNKSNSKKSTTPEYEIPVSYLNENIYEKPVPIQKSNVPKSNPFHPSKRPLPAIPKNNTVGNHIYETVY